MDFGMQFTLSETLYGFVARLMFVRTLCDFIARLCYGCSTRISINEATYRTDISDETLPTWEQLLKNAKLEIKRLRQEKQLLETEKQDALTRLSQLMSSKLRDNNPNIADLSDTFRPTKIAELLTELYDNEWTDAFSVLDQQYTEKQGITFLLDIIMEAYVFCEKELTESWSHVQNHYLIENDTVTAKSLKDARKKKVLRHIDETERHFSTHLSTHFNEYPSFSNNDAIKKYIMECVRLCLLMNANDPPVVIECPGWHPRIWKQAHTRMPMVNGKPTSGKAVVGIGIDEQPMPRQVFEKAVFKEYTCRGPYIEYIVWPITYLHRNGPMLAKGIAQGNNMQNSPHQNTELLCVVDVQK
ncbi:hypothetical protein DPMN_044414 [Dreissena polymorpha]|uniref:Mitochondria-eating protein C-terminal domain-containing protein n=1 Tax=Dreissena polymorpha TaxID=45954 RepID=A0A9D4D444_DREPO|nr:hypothetical protein DPMN_044414 [Dreissena polymorpha]